MGDIISGLIMLIGTYTNNGESKGIYTYRFDELSGMATPLSSAFTPNPSFVAVAGDVVYAVAEAPADTAGVAALSLSLSDGTLRPLGGRNINAGGPCYVTHLEKMVVTSNYSGGSLSLVPLDGKGLLQPAKEVLQFHGTGPDPKRQTKSHLHSAQPTPDGKYLIAADLGGDCLYRLEIKDGSVTDKPAEKITLPTGSGPRHFTFSRDGRYMYLLNELSGSVIAFSYKDGDLRHIQEIQADTLHARGSADIHLSPDGKFLYASNRLKGDGIAIFSVDSSTGMLTKAGYQPTGIHPRNFAITPNGRYLLVACREDNMIQVFSRDPQTGLLTDTGRGIAIPQPVCVVFR